LSARGETRDAELLKVGETCQMAIPSQAPAARTCQGEGVETRRAAPNARTRYGEGIVQTTNKPTRSTAPGGAAKAVAGKKIPRLARAVPVQVRPPAPTLRGFKVPNVQIGQRLLLAEFARSPLSAALSVVGAWIWRIRAHITLQNTICLKNNVGSARSSKIKSVP